MTTEIDRHVFVIFGGTGDLARRKLIPSLNRLNTENGIADRCFLLNGERVKMLGALSSLTYLK